MLVAETSMSIEPLQATHLADVKTVIVDWLQEYETQNRTKITDVLQVIILQA